MAHVIGGRLEQLAVRAPKRRARIETLLTRFDHRAATAARFAAPAVDPKIFLAIHSARRSAKPRIHRALSAGGIRDVGNEELSRCGYQTRKLGNAQ